MAVNHGHIKNTRGLRFGLAGGANRHIRTFEELQIQVNEMRGHSPWKTGRILVYSAISTSFVVIAAVI